MKLACAWREFPTGVAIHACKPFPCLTKWQLGECRRSTAGNGAALAAAKSVGMSSLQEPKSIKSRLSGGEQLYGAFMVSFSTVVAEILGYAGYDFVVVDMEHGPGDTISALSILQTLAGTGTPAILRLPFNDPVLVKKALDLGPAGLMFPMIEDAEGARRAVAACRYPPQGIRGAAHSLIRASRYGLNSEYLQRCEEELFIMCQVESKEAVECIPQIAEVEGVDCIQMGPTDLRASIGLLRSPGDSRAKELLRAAEKAVLSSKRKVHLAGFATPEDPPGFLFQQGYDMVSGAVDVCLMRDAVVDDLRKNKQAARVPR